MASCSGAEIYSWFQQSSAAARIDTIVNLVTMLHPAELRFLSTWVEFQSRKDTDTLRPFETRGNDPTYLCQLTDPSDSTIRNSLIFSMSLMHLANDKAATIVYSSLLQLNHLPLPISKEGQDELQVLLAIACAHPAFNFDQHMMLVDVRKSVEAKLKTYCAAELLTNHFQQSPSSSEETAMASVSNDEALMAEPLVKDVASQTNSPPSNNNQLCFRCKRSGVIATPIRVLNDRDADCSGSQKVVIKSVEVKGSQTNPDKDDVEFVLQIVWSDGRIAEISRTYREFVEFDRKLSKLVEKHNDSFPERSVLDVPQFPLLVGQTSEDSMAEVPYRIGVYLKSVFDLPFQFSSASVVQDFFEGQLVSVESSSCVTSLFESPSGGSISTQISPNTDDSNGYDNDCRRKSLTIYNTNTASIGSHDRLNDVEILTSR